MQTCRAFGVAVAWILSCFGTKKNSLEVSRVKGFKPVLPHTMDPTNLYIKGLPSNADELLGQENWQLPRYAFFAGDVFHCEDFFTSFLFFFLTLRTKTFVQNFVINALSPAVVLNSAVL